MTGLPSRLSSAIRFSRRNPVCELVVKAAFLSASFKLLASTIKVFLLFVLGLIDENLYLVTILPF